MQNQAYITQEQEAGRTTITRCQSSSGRRKAPGSQMGGSALFGLPQRLLGLNFGHRHPRLIGAAHRQLDRLTLTSRAIHSDQPGPSAPSSPTCSEWTARCR